MKGDACIPMRRLTAYHIRTFQITSVAAVAMAAALVPVLFAYGGWQQTNNIAEEFVDPRRVLPKPSSQV